MLRRSRDNRGLESWRQEGDFTLLELPSNVNRSELIRSINFISNKWDTKIKRFSFTRTDIGQQATYTFFITTRDREALKSFLIDNEMPFSEVNPGSEELHLNVRSDTFTQYLDNIERFDPHISMIKEKLKSVFNVAVMVEIPNKTLRYSPNNKRERSTEESTPENPAKDARILPSSPS